MSISAGLGVWDGMGALHGWMIDEAQLTTWHGEIKIDECLQMKLSLDMSIRLSQSDWDIRAPALIRIPSSLQSLAQTHYIWDCKCPSLLRMLSPSVMSRFDKTTS